MTRRGWFSISVGTMSFVGLLFLFCWYPHHTPVMHPSLIEFYGGLDLGMHYNQLRGINKSLHFASSEGPYCGALTKIPDSFSLYVSIHEPSLLSLFIPYGDVDELTAELELYRDDQDEDMLFYSWVSEFKRKLPVEPVHYYEYISDVSDREFEIFLWHFDTYNFEVWRRPKFERQPRRNVIMTARYAEDNKPFVSDVDSLFRITADGKMIRVDPEERTDW